MIYKKANRFKIKIASPVIILPFTGDSSPEIPCWVIRLGDLEILSIENSTDTSIV